MPDLWKRLRAAVTPKPEPASRRRRADETPEERSARRRANGWGPADSAEDNSYGGGI